MSFLDHWFLSWDKSLTRWSGILEWMNPFYIDSYRKYSFCFLTFQILNIKNTLVQEPRLHCIKLFLDKDDLCDLINIVHNEFSHLALSLSLSLFIFICIISYPSNYILLYPHPSQNILYPQNNISAFTIFLW